MGPSQSKVQQNGDINININHPKFSNAKLIKFGQSQQLQSTQGVDEAEYTKWKTLLTKAQLDDEYILLPKKHQFNTKALCGDSGTAKINYDSYTYLLTEEIYNRKGKKTKFEQWELCAAQNEMKRKTGGKLGDIRPQNIFINQSGNIKISSMLSWPRESSNYTKAYDHQTTYLAPEDMLKLEMGNLEDTTNSSSEIFSIGLTLLSAGMLQDFSHLYNIKTFKFDSKRAQEYLYEWKSNTVYSQIITAFISNLCSFQSNKRLTDEELWEFIKQFEEPIKNKEDFQILQAPLKIQHQIQQTRQLFPVQQLPHQQFQQAWNDKSVVQSYLPIQHVFQPPQLQGPPRESKIIGNPRLSQGPPVLPPPLQNNPHLGQYVRTSGVPAFQTIQYEGQPVRLNQFNQSGQIIQQNIPLNNQINPNNIISPYRQMIETQGINGGRIEQTVYIQRPDSLKNLSSNNQ